MAKTLVISDANILIDIEVSGLTEVVFELEYSLAVSDTLFYEEIAPFNPKLINSDLIIFPFDGKTNNLLVEKTECYRSIALSRNDISAMVLALVNECILLTGERLLRGVAEDEGLEVHGMLWLMKALFDNGLIDVDAATDAYEAMRQDGSFLPWSDVEKQLKIFRKT